ncbi:iron uptake transporter permease EfeU [Mycolicibacterium palauense]|uniref:iron uptake transporter permease EfeU n=1 Tax=Mycolicibacterium palauense TaxID=2034511 RepID=UPI0011453768|nr:iron uptake transporter permease EfeU [Mycolicibacterium palauense]
MQGIFVGTFLIGLREGLEATLIVSIVGAFLKRNGRSVRPMLAGVGLAVAISIAVGVALSLLSESLPQRQQEMLETVVGAIAVVFVTTMIIWMNRNAAQMKGELEREAQQAITAGGSLALATMAFLAVLKEGFETSVFLLAAAQASGGSRWWAVSGATAGIATAIAIGVGIYYGGLKLNLSRFFRITGVFLVLIAAGLVVSTLRTAHEAGWINIGQERVFDFSAWMSTRSVLGAVVTGVFGIPTDPRLIEVLGWVLYTVPVLIVFLWPAQLVAGPRARRRLLLGTAAVIGVSAVALAVFVPSGGALPGPTRVATADEGPDEVHSLIITLHRDHDTRLLSVPGAPGVTLEAAGTQVIDGVPVEVWQARVPADPGMASGTVSLDELAQLAGGRLPVGLGAARTPGPFDAQWSASIVYNVLSHGDALVHAEAVSTRIATLQGTGISGAKTVSVGSLSDDWSTASSEDQAVIDQIAGAAQDKAEHLLWKAWLPVLLALGAACIVYSALRKGFTPDGKERTQPHHGAESKQDRLATP